MKKILTSVLIFLLLAGCVGGRVSNISSEQEGISPYQLSDGQREILQAFGMEQRAFLLSFHAPEEAAQLRISVLRLEADGTWATVDTGGISLSPELGIEALQGTVAIQVEEDHALQFTINCSGQYTFTSPVLPLDQEMCSSQIRFLSEYQPISLNAQIPVALLVYDSGTAMETYTLADFSHPEAFLGMDLVQVVTLEFSDRPI
jgi:hypothetical protein